jgi:hypothetical protein
VEEVEEDGTKEAEGKIDKSLNEAKPKEEIVIEEKHNSYE